MWRDRDLKAPSRRAFLKSGGALVVAFFMPAAIRHAFAEGAPAAKPPVSPNAFIRIAPDESVTILLKHSEMGQGVWTSIPMVIAEELACDLANVRVEHAPAAPAYAHTAFGMQMTGGSTSTSSSCQPPSTRAPGGRTSVATRPARRSCWPCRYFAGLPMSSQ